MARKTKNPPNEADVLLTNYIDQTLANTGKIGWSSEEVTGMVQEVMKRFLERCLESEMDFHLKNGEIIPRKKTESEPEAQEAANKRNGTSSKTVLTDNSKVRIDVPRDRLSTFDPISVPKYERHLKGLDDKIISMYARGMSNREISVDFSHYFRWLFANFSERFLSFRKRHLFSEIMKPTVLRKTNGNLRIFLH